MNILQRLALAAIARYQRKGGGLERFRVDCNFEPRCSDYAATAIRRFGFRRGLRLSIGRIRRCNERDQVGLRQDAVPTAAVTRQAGLCSEAHRDQEHQNLNQERCHHV